MNKRLKRTIVIVIAAVLLIAAAAAAFFAVKSNSAGYRSISISEIFGRVMTESGGKTYEAYKNMRLADGYALTTDTESYTRMLLDDDKYVKLEQQSHAIFEALGDSKQHRTSIRLEKGALTTEITKPLRDDESYVVNTPNAVLAVRGTFFRIEVKTGVNGDEYTDVYTYGGTVACRRVMPDGSIVDENVLVPAGYKACIKMDEIITIYVEEQIEQTSDNIDPLELSGIGEADLVDVYNASRLGHDMFLPTAKLWDEILHRDIALDDHRSVYDGGKIPPYETDANDLPDSTPGDTGNLRENTESGSDGTDPDRDDSDGTHGGTSGSIPDNFSDTPSTVTDGNVSENDILSTDGENSEISDYAPTPPDNDYDDLNSGFGNTDSTPDDTAGNSGSGGTGSNADDNSVGDNTSNIGDDNGENPGDTSGDYGNITNETPEVSDGITDEAPAETSEDTDEGLTVEPTGESNSEPAQTGESADGGNTYEAEDNGSSDTPEDNSSHHVPIRTPASNIHTHDVEEIRVEPTCVDSGKLTERCMTCGKVLGETVIPALGHTESEQRTPATCTEAGKVTVKCAVCGVVISETPIPATGHTEIFTDTPASCTEDGSRVYFCSSCETILNREALPATGHTETTVTAPATCTEDGSVTVSCTICGAVIGETVIPAKGHNEVSEETPATCTEGGRLTVTCSECDYISETVIPAKGHSFGDYISNNNATCLTDGTMTALCEVCGERDTIADEGSILPHTPEIVTVPSTCVENGSETVICKVCEAIITPEKELPLAEHTEITSTEGNIETVSCSVCGEVIRQTNTETGVVYPVEIGAENFPDEVFRQYVRDNFDTDRDGKLSLEECGAVTAIDVSGSESADGGMTSLKGIEIFADLHDLNCGNNSGLTELDVSANKGLTILDCRNIPITSLDVSSSAKLEQLYCSDTEITTLDLSANTALSNLYCGGCGLAYVDLSDCSMPVMLFVADDNRHLIHVVDGTFDLKSIDGFDISRIVDGTLTGATMDENGVISGITEGVEITYTYDTKGTNVDMFKAGFTLVPDENSTFAPETPEGVAINAENFPDEKFREYVTTNFDTDSNGYLSRTECDVVTVVNVSGVSDDGGITSIDGIENFTKLEKLYCSNNSGLTGLDVSNNTELTYLSCGNTQIVSLDVSSNTELTWLYCYMTPISSLDVSMNKALIALNCSKTQVSSLDISKNTALQELYCQITPISSLDVSNNMALKYMYCTQTQITSLDLRNHTELQSLYFEDTKLAFVDISNSPNITALYTNRSKHPIKVENGTFDLRNIEGLDINRVSEFMGATMENGIVSGISENTEITYTYDCGQNLYRMFTLVPDESSSFAPETSDDVAINAENFPDEKFREYVTTNFDTDSNGYLSQTECDAVTEINVYRDDFSSNEEQQFDFNIEALDGLQFFSKLETLDCYGRSSLTSIDVTQNKLLTRLICSDTNVRELNISNNTALTRLWCSSTEITTLDVSKNTALTDLHCSNCQLRFVDISNNPNLTTLSADGNTFIVPVNSASIDTSSEYEFTSIGFNFRNVYDVTGADYSRESGIFDNFTSDTVTYNYDCDGDGVGDTEFTMVRSGETTFSLSSEDGGTAEAPLLLQDAPDALMPPGDANEGSPIISDEALPPENIAAMLLPAGIFTLAYLRKRKTALRYKRKAEI